MKNVLLSFLFATLFLSQNSFGNATFESEPRQAPHPTSDLLDEMVWLGYLFAGLPAFLIYLGQDSPVPVDRGAPTMART